MITYTTSNKTGYRHRTWENAGADATIAFAYDFNSAGEKLTKKCVLAQKRTYIPIHMDKFATHLDFLVDKAVISLNANQSVTPITLNIAGNGLKTLEYYGVNQELIDQAVFRFLKRVITHPKTKFQIKQIRSGGQTGVDEAGIKAALKLQIPALVHAPRDWIFRDENGKDISSETYFKERFLTS